jgi:hypothetical protein
MMSPTLRLTTSLLWAFFVIDSLGQQTGLIMCDDGETMGYTDITELRNDLLIPEGEGVFTLCPDSVFDLTAEPLTVSHSVVLKCGENGSFFDNCIFEGGKNQVIIEGDLAFIEFHGLIFQLSNQTSILIVANDSFVTFSECLWRDHVGDSLVLIVEAPPFSGGIVVPDGDDDFDNTTDLQLNSTDANSTGTLLTNNTGDFDGIPGPGEIAGAMLEDGTGNPDDALEYEPKAEIIIDPPYYAPGEITIDPPHEGGDIISGDIRDQPTTIDDRTVYDAYQKIAPSLGRKRAHHGGRLLLLSTMNTSVTFEQCEFLVSSRSHAQA